MNDSSEKHREWRVGKLFTTPHSPLPFPLITLRDRLNAVYDRQRFARNIPAQTFFEKRARIELGQITAGLQYFQGLLRVLLDPIPPFRPEGFSQPGDLSARSQVRELQRRPGPRLQVLSQIDPAVGFGPPQLFNLRAEPVDDDDLASLPPNVQPFATRLAFANDEMSGNSRGYPAAGQMLIFRPIDRSRRAAGHAGSAERVKPATARQ